ncbi:MAG: ArsC family reductase [Proteobacteria bacterium]|nr:ArsC family reductase [Pseudomonadota bacterium]MDA0928982.1 ArsC family reductase [Pseudomonadota bacterium]
MTTIYGISNCDTMKKARNWLQANGLAYDFHDYKKSGCDSTLAKQLLSRFTLEQVINKRGTTWRKLDDAVKEKLTVNSAAALMTENPSLIKRPILQHGRSWLIGFDEKEWQATLL